jgi:hypothetical protein
MGDMNQNNFNNEEFEEWDPEPKRESPYELNGDNLERGGGGGDFFGMPTLVLLYGAVH